MRGGVMAGLWCFQDFLQGDDVGSEGGETGRHRGEPCGIVAVAFPGIKGHHTHGSVAALGHLTTAHPRWSGRLSRQRGQNVIYFGSRRSGWRSPNAGGTSSSVTLSCWLCPSRSRRLPPPPQPSRPRLI